MSPACACLCCPERTWWWVKRSPHCPPAVPLTSCACHCTAAAQTKAWPVVPRAQGWTWASSTPERPKSTQGLWKQANLDQNQGLFFPLFKNIYFLIIKKKNVSHVNEFWSFFCQAHKTISKESHLFPSFVVFMFITEHLCRAKTENWECQKLRKEEVIWKIILCLLCCHANMFCDEIGYLQTGIFHCCAWHTPIQVTLGQLHAETG